MRILVFGDSVEYGAWDSQGGWVDRVKQQLHQEFLDSKGKAKHQLLNLGIGGDTSTKILARMDAEIHARDSKGWPLVLIFSFGTNDERTVDDQPEVNTETFKTNIQQIITKAHKYTDKILFVGCSPLREPVVDFKTHRYIDAQVAAYEDILRAEVETTGVQFVEIRSVLTEKGASIFSDDGIHPNDDGHKLIAQTALPHIRSMIS